MLRTEGAVTVLGRGLTLGKSGEWDWERGRRGQNRRRTMTIRKVWKSKTASRQ
jgi:hypothetical protein